MSEYHHLIGAEDVRAGGYAVERGAETIQNSVSTMEWALQQHARALEDHQIFLRDWLTEYKRVTKAGADRFPPHGMGPL